VELISVHPRPRKARLSVVKREVVVSEGAVIAIFGDGRLDMKVFELVVTRLNHGTHKIVQVLLRGGKGLKGVVETIAKLLDARVKPRTFIAVLDREHVESVDQLKKVLTREYGFEIKELELVGENVYKVKCSRGPVEVTVYLALLGLSERGMLEEHIAELVKAIYKVDVKPTKESLRRWLRERGIELEELIKRAPLDSVRDALRPLYDLIAAVERDP